MDAIVVILIVILLLVEGRRDAISTRKKRDGGRSQERRQLSGGSGHRSRDRLHANAVLTPHARRVLSRLGEGARAIVHYNEEPSMKVAEIQSASSLTVVDSKRAEGN
jgi:hypothetical protein